MEKERVEYIDVARGIGIMLVIIGHIVWGGNYEMRGSETISNFIYSFHMPLFFVINGLCIKETKQFNFATIKKMAKAYIIPYIVWTVFFLLAFQFIGTIRGQGTLFNLKNGQFAHAVSICGLAPLWFLLALFISESVVLMLKPLFKVRGGTA